MSQDKNKKGKGRLFACILLPICLLALLVPVGLCGFSHYKTYVKEPQARRQADLDRLATESYDGFFLSTIDPGYTQHDFATYKAYEILPIKERPKNFASISDYFSAADGSVNVLSQVYLSFDPLEVWEESECNSEVWEELLNTVLLSRISMDLECTYTFLLPYYPISYWSAMTQEEFDTACVLYQATVSRLFSCPNVRIFTYQDLEWLICNEGNYYWVYDKKGNASLSPELILHEEVGETLFLEGLVDGGYELISVENAEKQQKNAQLRAEATSKETEPEQYHTIDAMLETLKCCVAGQTSEASEENTLANTTIIFLGDSIIGNYDNPSGISALTGYFTGATTFNCAVGGSCAAHVDEESTGDFLAVTAYLLGQKNIPSDLREDFTQAREYLAYRQSTTSTDRLVFVIEYGLNDYFLGNRINSSKGKISTFKTSLQKGIEDLQAVYPDAVFVTIATGYTGYYNNGEDKCSLKGAPLKDYNTAMLEFSEGNAIACFDLRSDTVFTQDNLYDYSNDGVHYNSNGRYVLTKAFATWLAAHL